MHSAVI